MTFKDTMLWWQAWAEMWLDSWTMLLSMHAARLARLKNELQNRS